VDAGPRTRYLVFGRGRGWWPGSIIVDVGYPNGMESSDLSAKHPHNRHHHQQQQQLDDNGRSGSNYDKRKKGTRKKGNAAGERGGSKLLMIISYTT
jgi:hypothetical protein